MNPMTEAQQQQQRQPQQVQSLPDRSLMNPEDVVVPPNMSTTELMETNPPPCCSSTVHHEDIASRPIKKRRRVEELTESVEKQQSSCDFPHRKSDLRRQVSWNDDKNMIHLQDDPSKVFPTEYNESDIWYSRRDYEHFLLDRINTVERIRGEMLQKETAQVTMGNEEERLSPTVAAQETTSSCFNNDHHCMRGLEPFRNNSTHQDMHSQRKLHKSTVIVEQCRQAMLGIKDPERFRFLVAPQSNLALLRAQQQAVMDEEEVYPQRRHRRQSRRFTVSAVPSTASLVANNPNNNHELGEKFPSSNSSDPVVTSASLPMTMNHMLRFGRSNSLDLAKASSIVTGSGTASLTDHFKFAKSSLFSADIREMQERNARRLMEIYKRPDGGMFWYTNGSGKVFRSRLLETVADAKVRLQHPPFDYAKPSTSSNKPKPTEGKLSSRKKGHDDKLPPGVNIAKSNLLLVLFLSLGWSVNAFLTPLPSMVYPKLGSEPEFYESRLWIGVNDQMEGIDAVNQTRTMSGLAGDISTVPYEATLHQQQGHEYSFYDEATIHVRAGSGGQGSSTYKKGVGNQNGPPDGGNGGKGGDVYLIVDNSLNTLAGLNPSSWRPNAFGGSGAARSGGMSTSSSSKLLSKSFRAENGSDGARQLKDGRFGKDVFVRVPPGTLVQEVHLVLDKNGIEKEILVDLGSIMSESDETAKDEVVSTKPASSQGTSTLLVAKGGEGGEGSGINNKARGVHRPRVPPKRGERKMLRLTLKLIADVALVGVPNAGKSTFLASVTRAKPRIADYPFTTVIPNLGVWVPSETFSSNDGSGGDGLVLCDVPGLIEGASRGVGLGHTFLRHVERCHVILHLIDATAEDPILNFNMLNQELVKYGTGQLAQMPQVVVVNKVDALESNPDCYKYSRLELEEELKAAMSHTRLMWMSAKEGDGVEEVMERLYMFVKKLMKTASSGN